MGRCAGLRKGLRTTALPPPLPVQTRYERALHLEEGESRVKLIRRSQADTPTQRVALQETGMSKFKKRAHRSFTAEAVKLVRVSAKTVGEVARDLDLTETALRDWVIGRVRDQQPAR